MKRAPGRSITANDLNMRGLSKWSSSDTCSSEDLSFDLDESDLKYENNFWKNKKEPKYYKPKYRCSFKRNNVIKSFNKFPVPKKRKSSTNEEENK